MVGGRTTYSMYVVCSAIESCSFHESKLRLKTQDSKRH